MESYLNYNVNVRRIFYERSRSRWEAEAGRTCKPQVERDLRMLALGPEGHSTSQEVTSYRQKLEGAKS